MQRNTAGLHSGIINLQSDLLLLQMLAGLCSGLKDSPQGSGPQVDFYISFHNI